MWALNGKPFAVQTEALKRSAGKLRYAYFMEQGLGKTSVTLADFVRAAMADEVDVMVVLCPNSLKGVWRDEAIEWGVNTPIILWPDQPPDKPPFIFVINYDSLIYKGEDAILDVLKAHQAFVTLDESSAIKNPGAQRTKKVISLVKLAAMVRILTGTPVTQGPHDLWAQLRAIGLLVGFNFYAFRNRYCKMGGYMNRQIVGHKNEEELNELMADHAFRALKSDWAKDLPEKLPKNRYVEMTKKQKTAYQTMLDDFYAQIDEDEIVVQQAINQISKLQQISSGFIIDEESEIIEIIAPAKNPKLAVTTEILDEIQGKAVIFIIYRHSMSMLLDFFADRNPAFLKGGMKPSEIDEQKAKFKGDSTCRMIVTQIKVGKYGHTLLGGKRPEDKCSDAIFFENSYSLEERSQGEDRIHRYGADRTVVYHDLIASEIDKTVIKALQKKKSMSKAVMDLIKEKPDA